MVWKKLGNIFCPHHHFPWMVSHAAQPFAEVLQDGYVKIYFNTRNAQNQSSVGWVIINMADFFITAISNHPVLSPGVPGLFDDSGVSMAQLITVDHIKRLYYVGWNLKVTVPWQNSIGVATYNTALNRFEKFADAPVIDRNHHDPYSLSYPYILIENNRFKMWYGSNVCWGRRDEDMQHVIKYAESDDGISWERKNEIAISLKEGEFAVARPFLFKTVAGYEMWYSYRSLINNGYYSIGYATSQDGKTWHRKDDEAGIDVSAHGWDSEMVCYASVFELNEQTYMLYNGNSYGKTGFGLAVLEK